jgi:competence CoiA-like predicted nuclease
MDYAFDTYLGIIVEATNASHSRQRYKCPVCNADCYLRAGQFRRPHFAHDSGEALED